MCNVCVYGTLWQNPNNVLAIPVNIHQNKYYANQPRFFPLAHSLSLFLSRPRSMKCNAISERKLQPKIQNRLQGKQERKMYSNIFIASDSIRAQPVCGFIEPHFRFFIYFFVFCYYYFMLFAAFRIAKLQLPSLPNPHKPYTSWITYHLPMDLFWKYETNSKYHRLEFRMGINKQ